MRWGILILVIVFAATAIFIGCSKEEETPPEPPSITAPQLTTIAYTDSIKVVWEDSPEADESGFKGYYFYAANTDLSGLSESELDSFLISSTPELFNEYLLPDYGDTSLDINGIYYFGIRAVRTVDSGDTLSPLRIVETSPVIIGSGKIFEYSSDSACAFNFAESTAITSSETSPNPDFYLDTCSVCSVSGYAVKSPHLSTSAWTGECGFKLLGTGDPDNFSDTDDSGMSDYYEISMQVYAIKTSTNYFVKMWVTGFGGEFPNKYIEFKYKYQTKVSYPHF